MKILVTGSNGYLIRNLKNCFGGHETGFIVRDKSKPGTEKNKIIFEADIRDFNKMKQIMSEFNPDLIIHAAAKILIEDCLCEDKEMYGTNVGGTKNIMKLAPRGSTIIFLSSMTVYSDENRSPVSENDLCNPPHFYGFTKLIGEETVKYYSGCRDLSYLILRLPGLFGGDRKGGFIYSTITKCMKNEEIVLDTENLVYWQTISVEEIDHILKGIIEKVQTTKFRTTYNLSYNEDTDFIGTARFIASELNSESDIVVKEPVGYIKFELSGQKLLDELNLSTMNNYHDSLRQYINRIKGL